MQIDCINLITTPIIWDHGPSAVEHSQRVTAAGRKKRKKKNTQTSRYPINALIKNTKRAAYMRIGADWHLMDAADQLSPPASRRRQRTNEMD